MKIAVVIPEFCDAARAIALAHAMRAQEVPEATELQIIIVDDGSPDETLVMLRACKEGQFDLHVLPENRGRAAARNAGASVSDADIIAFVDCDCVPTDGSFLARHVAQFTDGVVASVGAVKGVHGDFWDHYQASASRRRERAHADGAYYMGSSQNLVVRRSSFIEAGQFDEDYRSYGFEDRDLLLRLGALGRVVWSQGGGVSHLDDIRLRDVVEKMIEAGRFTSQIFSARHPDAYKRLGYAAIDAGIHPALLPIARILGPLLLGSLKLFQRKLPSSGAMYLAAAYIVKACTAVGFLYGTATRNNTAPSAGGGDH